MKKNIPIIMGLMMSGCSTPMSFSPENLPNANINQYYEDDIEITGGVVSEDNFSSEVSSKDFTILPSDSYEKYNLLTVSGTPTTSEPIRIYINGYTYGTNFPGKDFEKEYIIEVKH